MKHLKHSSFDATISALDAETSALGSAIARRSYDATISALNAETSALDAETSVIARSYRWYRRRVFGDIGDCDVGITPQMCNRVTNHGYMGTFSKPVTLHAHSRHSALTSRHLAYIYTYIYTHTHTHIYIYIYIYILKWSWELESSIYIYIYSPDEAASGDERKISFSLLFEDLQKFT